MIIVIFYQILFFIAFLGIFTVLAGYPLMVWIGALFIRRRKSPVAPPPFSVSLIIVVHNGADLVFPKFQNSIALNYPKEQLEILFFSDGSDDGTAELLKGLNHFNVHTLIVERHEGKFKGLNHAARIAGGEILIFSDIDALLKPDAVSLIVRHFSDDSVGGVCGQRCVGERKRPLSGAQRLYVALDSYIKRCESRMGSLTANDGKLYAVRKSLFRPIPPGVTDDLYAALNIIRRKKHFIFEPDAVAVVKLPSRDARHEVERRRRIVSRSLNSIFHVRELLDPRKHGFYAIRLLVNKLLRRCLPLFLLILLPTSLVLHAKSPFYALIFWIQVLFYLTAALFPMIPIEKRKSTLAKIASTAFYICAGMYGTLLGLMDFIRKPPPAKWTPVKKDW